MNIKAIKYNVVLNVKNIPGPTVAKKIVVLECDDFGGIRMPSVEVLTRLKAEQVPVNLSRYNLLDTLEDKEDLAQLFEVLSSVKDKEGNPAVMSPFVNVANPDFDKIKAAGYSRYFYEPFTTTLQKYNRHPDTMKVWKQGMESGIFSPEFHGREHIAVQPWLQKLQEGNPSLLKAFDNGFVAVNNVDGLQQNLQEFRPEFHFTNISQKPFLHQSINEGVKLFERLFGYKPSSFTPSNSVFHPDFEKTVYAAEVPFLVVAHKNPTPANDGQIIFTNYTFRQKIKDNQLNFYIRNCAFEPNDESYTSMDITLRQISAAFRWKKPAIISTHRVNFVGGINKQNREEGLKELHSLLKTIVKRWPDVEFMSTANMLKELKN